MHDAPNMWPAVILFAAATIVMITGFVWMCIWVRDGDRSKLVNKANPPSPRRRWHHP